jgi:ABC-type glycerol-3-phosphate transport system substrate-binding protein
MKQIKYLALALLIVPALYLLAFGPSSDAPAPPDRIVVDYWEKWTASEQAQMGIIVDDFNNTVGKEKNIFVRYVSTSDVNKKTLVATAAGVPPDIAGMWDYNLVQFAELDALEPLEDMATAHGITRETYKPVFWDACNYNGHLYALISTPASVALHYNIKAFRDAGLDHPPGSIAELDADAKLLDKVDASGHIIRAGYLPAEPGWYINNTYVWFGGDIWDAKNRKFTLTDPRVVAAYKWMQGYSRRLGKDATNEFHSGMGNFDSPQNAFLIGTVLMEQQGPWMANYIYNLKPSLDGLTPGEPDDVTLTVEERRKRMEWAVAPFPSNDPALKDATFCGFDTLVIPRGAKHVKEAFEFIAYVNRQDVMEKLCQMHSKCSPLRQVSDNFLHHHKNPYIDVFERLCNSPNAHSDPQIPIYPEVQDELLAFSQKLLLLEADPQTELQSLQDRLQKIYDSFEEKQRARKQLAADSH